MSNATQMIQISKSNKTNQEEETKEYESEKSWWEHLLSSMFPCKIYLPWTNTNSTRTTVVIITIVYSSKKNKINLCFQEDAASTRPYLILEFPIAKFLIDNDACRVMLECDRDEPASGYLLDVMKWQVVFNGRNLGFASRVEMEEKDNDVMEALEKIRACGVGMLKVKDGESEMEYFRGRFERVVGSVHSESYHLVHPAVYQLSFFFLRL